MKFSTRINAEISADQLFDKVTNFNRLERDLNRKNITVIRIDPADEPGAGMAWKLVFDWRGKRHLVRLDVRRFHRPDIVVIKGISDLFDLLITSTIFGLAQNRSRLIFEMDIRPRNMRARVMLHSARLTKRRLDARFEQRINALFGSGPPEVIPAGLPLFQPGAAVLRSGSAG